VVSKVFSADKYIKALKEARPVRVLGKVTRVAGSLIESQGPPARIGEICLIGNGGVKAEVIGFRAPNLLLSPLGPMQGIAPGVMVRATERQLTVGVGPGLLGRVLDGLGQPLDGKGPVAAREEYPLENTPPHPLLRPRIKKILPVGVRAVDGLLTCGRGQRMGIFAGSGVGKSTLLGMMAKNTGADVNVIALIGERGREVRDFLEKVLGERGLEHSVVVVATSDQSPLCRVKGAFLATAIAEYFRDQGRDVLLLVDSLTRLAMAQRELGLAAGEPPTSKGYTPSVFTMFSRLLERSGTAERGSITGIYTVLVEGDDPNDPIADAVRGILDGHIVLSRRLAQANHYPAIDILASVSRLMMDLVTPEHLELAGRVRAALALHRENEDLINIGAYTPGSNAELDTALALFPRIRGFLCQGVAEGPSLTDTWQKLRAIFAQGE
jgi:flagellum-specific ATP synthase